jgi:hypothetical protein
MRRRRSSGDGPLVARVPSLVVHAYDVRRMGELAVGQDLYAVCGKCGDTYHVVVSLEEGKVTRVQCKQCMGYHRYRAPAGEQRVDEAARKKGTRRQVASRPLREGSPRRTVRRRDEPLVDPDLSRPVRRYRISETYEPGDRIEHPTFGEGVVETLPGPGKVQVFFEDGRRTLAQGRGATVSP